MARPASNAGTGQPLRPLYTGPQSDTRLTFCPPTEGCSCDSMPASLAARILWSEDRTTTCRSEGELAFKFVKPDINQCYWFLDAGEAPGQGYFQDMHLICAGPPSCEYREATGSTFSEPWTPTTPDFGIWTETAEGLSWNVSGGGLLQWRQNLFPPPVGSLSALYKTLPDAMGSSHWAILQTDFGIGNLSLIYEIQLRMGGSANPSDIIASLDVRNSEVYITIAGTKVAAPYTFTLGTPGKLTLDVKFIGDQAYACVFIDGTLIVSNTEFYNRPADLYHGHWMEMEYTGASNNVGYVDNYALDILPYAFPCSDDPDSCSQLYIKVGDINGSSPWHPVTRCTFSEEESPEICCMIWDFGSLPEQTQAGTNLPPGGQPASCCSGSSEMMIILEYVLESPPQRGCICCDDCIGTFGQQVELIGFENCGVAGTAPPGISPSLPFCPGRGFCGDGFGADTALVDSGDNEDFDCGGILWYCHLNLYCPDYYTDPGDYKLEVGWFEFEPDNGGIQQIETHTVTSWRCDAGGVDITFNSSSAPSPCLCSYTPRLKSTNLPLAALKVPSPPQDLDEYFS